MKTIGQILYEARSARKYSLRRIGEITKIKTNFIEAVENEKWEALPSFPTVLGFVKSLAGATGVEEKMAVAVLKRDYPPKKLNINPKPDVSSKFVWGPRLTFVIGVGAITALVFGYLIFQYVRFVSPPRLILESPKEDQAVSSGNVLVFGETDADAKITVNNQPVLVDSSGKFSVSISVVPETKEIVVRAISRSGKESDISRRIKIANN